MSSLSFNIFRLPEEIRKEVLDFMEFLLHKHRKESVNSHGEDKYPLRNTVVKYDDPLGPVAQDDWEVA